MTTGELVLSLLLITIVGHAIGIACIHSIDWFYAK